MSRPVVIHRIQARLTRFASRSWRAVLVALAAALVWVAHFDRWTPESWAIPTDYYIDAHETLARLKAASEGNLVPLQPQVIDRLGAPFGAHWNSYPSPDKPLMLALGALVPVFGLFATANLGLMLAQVSSALAFYLVARWLRARWEWAAAGAVLFAFTYHTFHRGLSHFSLVFTWTIPLGLVAVLLIAGSRRLEWRRPGAALCLVLAVAFGASNPYNLFFWLQLLGWALIFQLCGARRPANLQIGAAAFAVATVTFFVVHAENWLFTEDPNGLPLLARNYGGTERYALKPVEMFIPPPFHAWDWLAFFGHRYARWSEWRGEVFLPYLGIAGIAGLLWLGVFTLRRVVRRQPLPAAALALGWILAYSTIGGVTNVLALFAEFQVFRATNRAAIFVSAIMLLFLVVRLTRVSGRWPRSLVLGVTTVAALLGVRDQLPRPDSPGDRAALRAAVEADQRFGAELERVLPDGAMLFQLPVLGFPEVATPHQLNDYEHFRPYLTTTSLRFTYGAPKTRARGRWQRELAELPPAEFVAHLEEFGFAAIYLNRRGFTDRAESLLTELARLGYGQRISDATGDQIVVPLRDRGESRLPMSIAFTLGKGWHIRPDGDVRWAHSNGAVSYFNPHAQPVPVDVRLTLIAVAPREVTLRRDETVLARIQVSTTPTVLELPALEMHPGVNCFDLSSAEPAVRLGAGPNQLRSFGLRSSALRLAAGARPAGSPSLASSR